jgi:hypothetical protein
MNKAYRFFVLVAVAASATLPALAVEAVCAATSETCEYRLDTYASPRAIKTQTELDALWKATYSAGETVTVTAPGGTDSTLVSAAASAGEVALPFNAGGLWTAVNSAKGTATFTVRHSIFGTLGDGTSASPAKIVDTTEILDLLNSSTAGVGYVVTFAGASDLMDEVVLPGLYSLESAGEGLWSLATATGVGTVTSESDTYLLDTMQGGPDRTIKEKRRYAIAYSGDNWVGGASAASSVTVVPPRGASSTQNFTGTGATPFPFAGRGDTTVTMTAGSTVLTSVVTYDPSYGLVIIFK